MDVAEAIQQRYSVRKYEDRPVEEPKLLAVLDAARLAPSGSNRQPWKFVVARDAVTRAKLADACNSQTFIGTAPVVIAACGTMPDRMMSCDVPGDPVDVAIAIDHMTLAAVAEGLGSCWIGHFDQDACCELLGVPPTARIIELLTLGYPESSEPTKPRKTLDEVVCYEAFA